MKGFNLTALRFRYVGATNTDSSKFIVTQTNVNRRTGVNYNYDVSDTAEHILDLLGVDYSQIIDNTSKKSVDYVITSVTAKTGILDFIGKIKELKRKGII